MKAGPILQFLLLLFLLTPGRGFLITSDNNQALIDQLLHVVWEPSSLIRFWVGLDQLFNVVRSWRGVAKKLASLPFGGDGESHVRIQEPRSMYRKPSVGDQIDRFNQMYASSSLSPIVAQAREKYQYGDDYDGLNSVLSSLETADAKLPPSFLFKPQEVFMDKEWAEYFKNAEGRDYSEYLPKENDLKSVSSSLNSIRQSLPFRNGQKFGFPAANFAQGGSSIGMPVPYNGLRNLAQSVQDGDGVSMSSSSLSIVKNLPHLSQNNNGVSISVPFNALNDIPPSLHQHASGLNFPGPFKAIKNLGRYISQQMSGLRHSLPLQKPGFFGLSPGFPNGNGNRFPAPLLTSNVLNTAFQNQLAINPLASKLQDLQKQENRHMFLNQKYVHRPNVPQLPKPSESHDAVVNISPEEKLKMFLMLMNALGTIHTKKVATLQDLKLQLVQGQHAAAGTVHRNDDGEPPHISNFVDRDSAMVNDR